MGSIQIGIVETRETAVVEVDVSDDGIVGGAEALGRRSKDEELVDGAQIPSLENVREQPEAQLGGKERAQNQKGRDRWPSPVTGVRS